MIQYFNSLQVVREFVKEAVPVWGVKVFFQQCYDPKMVDNHHGAYFKQEC